MTDKELKKALVWVEAQSIAWIWGTAIIEKKGSELIARRPDELCEATGPPHPEA